MLTKDLPTTVLLVIIINFFFFFNFPKTRCSGMLLGCKMNGLTILTR